MGDFNEILSQEEKYGGIECRLKLIEDFWAVLMDCGLMDLGFKDFSILCQIRGSRIGLC